MIKVRVIVDQLIRSVAQADEVIVEYRHCWLGAPIATYSYQPTYVDPATTVVTPRLIQTIGTPVGTEAQSKFVSSVNFIVENSVARPMNPFDYVFTDNVYAPSNVSIAELRSLLRYDVISTYESIGITLTTKEVEITGFGGVTEKTVPSITNLYRGNPIGPGKVPNRTVSATSPNYLAKRGRVLLMATERLVDVGAGDFRLMDVRIVFKRMPTATGIQYRLFAFDESDDDLVSIAAGWSAAVATPAENNVKELGASIDLTLSTNAFLVQQSPRTLVLGIYRTGSSASADTMGLIKRVVVECF